MMTLEDYVRDIIKITDNETGNRRFVLIANILATMKTEGKKIGHQTAVDMVRTQLNIVSRGKSIY